MGQSAALDVIGVIGQIDLDFMINTAVQLRRFLGLQYLKKCLWCIGFLVNAIGLLRGFGYVPCLSGQKRAIYAPLCAVIPDAAFGQVPQLCGLLYFMTSTHLGALNKAQRNKIRPVSTPV